MDDLRNFPYLRQLTIDCAGAEGLAPSKPDAFEFSVLYAGTATGTQLSRLDYLAKRVLAEGRWQILCLRDHLDLTRAVDEILTDNFHALFRSWES